MTLYEMKDYKDFVRKKLRMDSKKGYGQYTKIAKHLNIHTSMVSQVFNGDKHLTFEQACGICSFFGLTDLETDYFVALVLSERAGNPEAKAKCQRDLRSIREKSESLKERLTKDAVLSEEHNAQFYSQWFYTATKLICSISGNQNAEAISEKLGVPLVQIKKALEFLLSVGLCVDLDGKIKPGFRNTHLGADSPLVSRHHQNWRVKGFEKMGSVKPTELFLTMPATMSEKDVELLRQKIVDFIEDFVKVIDSSKGETMYCLNIDWFDATKSSTM